MVEEIDIEMMEALLKQGAQLVDVREHEELEAGTIEGFTHMPLSCLEEYKDRLSKDRPIVFYCRSGRRSLKAAELAARWTTQPLYSLKGGYLNYSDH